MKVYENFYARSVDVFKQFIEETNDGSYPEERHVIEMSADVYEKFERQRKLED